MMSYLEEHYELIHKTPRLFALHVTREQLLDTLHQITTHTSFDTLSQLTCTDWIEEERFELGYMLTNALRSHNLMLKCSIARDKVTMPSLALLFAQAEVMERELHEMFGIGFEGNETLYDFALEGWCDIPPMRREFDTLAYVNAHYDFREGREDNLDVKEEIKKRKAAAKSAKETPSGA
ncbi:MAG: NADH-quinone oxidoreductase subunit C [Campylobacterales bacterium]|nr:NADH-quinone oxidoreductase subunit C [Campylobacterales bacterium]